MKEFIEKLIGRLEEYPHGKYEDEYGKGFSNGINVAIEEVNELAEEYINTSTDSSTNLVDTSTNTSSGWIPCSERLPDIEGNTSDTVLVCTINGFQHMAFWCDDEKWRYCESGMIKKPMEWTEIIAWMPLPAPYKEGE